MREKEVFHHGVWKEGTMSGARKSTARLTAMGALSCRRRRRVPGALFLFFITLTTITLVGKPVASQETCAAYSTACPCTAFRNYGFTDDCHSTEDAKCYVANYLDVASGDLAAAKTHATSTGVSQNRVTHCPSSDADWVCYKDNYDYDVGGANDAAAAKAHFFSTGYLLKRDPRCASSRVKDYPLLDRGGGDLAEANGVTKADCEATCRGNDDCFGFLFIPNLSRCYFKGTHAAGAAAHEGTFTYRLPAYFTVNFHGDKSGGDLSYHTSVSTVDGCAEKCRERFDCDAFSYRSNTDECWVKTTIPGAGNNELQSTILTDSQYQMYFRIGRVNA